MRFISTIPFFYCSILFLKINGANSQQKQHRVFFGSAESYGVEGGIEPEEGSMARCTRKEGRNKHICYLCLFFYRFPYFGASFDERFQTGFLRPQPSLERVSNQTSYRAEVRVGFHFLFPYHILQQYDTKQRNGTRPLKEG